MDEDSPADFIKLPVEERCLHKLWKARVHGYEEITKTFKQLDDEKSPEFAKYLGHIKKFVVDSNAVSQEKGLEAALAFVENYALAGRTVGDVMSGVVSKCIAAPKAKTRELAVQIALMYFEIEKQDAALEELLKGTDQKNPKIVAGCISTMTLALHEFGPKVVSVKPMVKKIPVLLADRDKTVRDETKAMAIEIYKWIGNEIKPQLAHLQPVQTTELEAEFAKVASEKVFPTRYLRSQQQKQAKLAAEAAVDFDEIGGGGDDGVSAQIDPYDFADPVDILSKLSKNFYEKIEEKKWTERKEAMEELENLLKAPKLESGDYGDLVRALKKIIAKDTNVVVVALAGKNLASLASGLKKRFQIYAGACIPVLLEKFREKKQNVVLAVRDALDAVFISTTIEAIMEDVLEALNNKNPSVKAETAAFLSRCFTKCQPAALNKKLLKAYTSALLKTLNEPDPVVRDNSAEALGTAMKLVGEKNIATFMTDVDNLKMTKIKECCDKAVIATVKPTIVKKERPSTAPVISKAESSAPVSVRRPVTASATNINSGTFTKKKAPNKVKTKQPPKQTEKELSMEEVEEIAVEIFGNEILNGLSDPNWKTRLASAENFVQRIETMSPENVSAQVLVKVLNKKPGLKDTNFQVAKLKLDAVNMLAKKFPFSSVTADSCLTDVADKLGDVKNSALAADTLSAIADATNIEYVSNEVLNFAFLQKNPKVQAESLLWLSNAIKEFGFSVNAKSVIEYAKKSLNATNPAVRTAGISLLGTVYLYMGASLNVLIDDEKPALKQQIMAEFEKCGNAKPPLPTRGLAKSSSCENVLEEVCEEEPEVSEQIQVKDILPRVDISSQITESLLDELADKNWKVRNEALQKVSNILNDAKLIQPNVGDLPRALSHRLVDSNSKIAQMALSICQTLAMAMGPRCKTHIRTVFPGFLQGLGDSKTWIRSASIECMNTWGEQSSFKDFFEGEMIGDALKTGSPTLRAELWNWLAEKLPKIPPKTIPKEELLVCLPCLYTNLEDRNAEVRKNAQETVFGFMLHLGYEVMARNTEKLKPGSKATVMAALDKVRPNLPVQAKLPPATLKEEKIVKPQGKSGAAKTSIKPKQSVAPGKPSSRKGEEEVDTSPLLAVNNLKHQRVIDEQKLRVLKWNFTTPREEFVELLKEQMLTANVNRSLIANMFHSDFRYHLKAIEALSEDIHANGPALAANLDLILKWMTLRFFDTNPSVLLKGLEYLQVAFNYLVQTKQRLWENEASSFIPYLILKVGDPKDAVRNGVRALFKQIELVYPVSKLFGFIMEGLKSKNARQRTECLDTMGSLIGIYGISICPPSAASCLKEIAKQISDRDNSVRNAALNAIVQAYFHEGEKVYKMVGQISDKDLSLLEERIKRASKTNIQRNVRSSTIPTPTQVPDPVVIQTEISEELNESEEESEDIPAAPSVVRPSPSKPAVTGPYGLDPDLLEQLEKTPIAVQKCQVENVDLSFLNEVSAATENQCVLPLLSTVQHSTKPTNFNSVTIGADLNIMKTINQIGNKDLAISMSAMELIQNILQAGDTSVVQDYEDHFMMAVILQLKSLKNLPNSPDSLKVYRSILTLLTAFYDTKTLGANVSTEVICDLLTQLVSLLIDDGFEASDTSSSYGKVLNHICCKLIERSNHTNMICALIKVLQGSVRSSHNPRFTELVMKCLWRVIKILPTWEEDIDYDTVLLEIHMFFKEFPSTWWKQKPSDTPVRSIKTLVHSMAKIKGNLLMKHMTRISDPGESELQSYLIRTLKTIKLDEVKHVPLKKDVRKSLSRTTHNMLSEIFQKIGSKEETKEGLNLLYDFRLQHPEADLEPYLKKSSQFFQDYIQKGLKEIEESRKTENKEKHSVKSFESDKYPIKTSDKETSKLNTASATVEAHEPTYWMNRLKMWREKGGVEPLHQNVDNKLRDENLNQTYVTPLQLLTMKDTTAEVKENTKVEELRRRLEAIKRQSS